MKQVAVYVCLIVAVNYGFAVVPMIQLPTGDMFPPMSLVVGFIFVARDYAQRAVGHWVIVAMLAGGINNTNIMISMFSFNFCWIFVDVFQSATVANVDHSGRFLALMPGAQGLGQLIGPNVAASILAIGLGYRGVFIMCGLSSLVAMLVYLFMYLRLKKAIPALADAS